MIFIERDPIVGIAKEKFRNLGVKGVLFDLDDTLIYTSEIFRRCMANYTESIAASTDIDEVLFAKQLSEINDREYYKYGVSPKRWDVVVNELSKIYQNEKEIIVDSLPVLKQIYKTIPRMREGVLPSLRAFREMEIKIGLVTHANEEWTNWKLDQLGLWNYFDAVVIADENQKKSSEHWLEGATLLNLKPGECLAVGDNLKGDILSGASLGMKTAWMPSPWSVYREGEVPSETMLINGIFDLLTA